MGASTSSNGTLATWPLGSETHRSWLSPERVTAAAIVLASTVASPVVLHLLDLTGRTRTPPTHPGIIMLCTAALTAVVAYKAAHAEHTRQALFWCLGAPAVFGALNWGLTLAVGALVIEGNAVAAIGFALLGSLIGLGIGAPIGIGFGMRITVPTLVCLRTRKHRTHASLERTLLVAGAWLTCTSTVAAAVIIHSIDSIPALIASGVGLVAVSIGARLAFRRRRWLARVRAGAVPGWAIRAREERDDAQADEELRPFVDRPANACGEVLVRLEDASAYRGNAIALALC